jgi:hypothetical protein
MMIRNLSVLNYAQGFTHWHYKIDSIPSSYLNEWNESGFWNDAKDMFVIGDVITISATQPLVSGPRVVLLAIDDNRENVKLVRVL